MIYAATKAYMPDCPVCNGSRWGSETPIAFFRSMEEFKEAVIKDLNSFEYGDLYCDNGEQIFSVEYRASFHNYREIRLINYSCRWQKDNIIEEFIAKLENNWVWEKLR